MRYFVFVFDRMRGAIIEREDYGADERPRAWAASDRLTRKYISDANIEVVLLGSASEAELRATHGRYFEPVLSGT
jgi:hypothetical protein